MSSHMNKSSKHSVTDVFVVAAAAVFEGRGGGDTIKPVVCCWREEERLKLVGMWILPAPSIFQENNNNNNNNKNNLGHQRKIHNDNKVLISSMFVFNYILKKKKSYLFTIIIFV